jgi:RNA polymerase sigma-70 factor (ECF subfamily)
MTARPARGAAALSTAGRSPRSADGGGREKPRAWDRSSGPSARSSGPSAEEDELASLRARDEATFVTLVTRHHSALLRVAMAYLRCRASAEEAVQDTWLGVLRGLDGFEGRSSVESWIFSILVNCAKTRAVREQRTVPFSDVSDRDGEAPATAADRFLDEGAWAGGWADSPRPWPDAAVESGELVALVRDALETLTEAQRTVMTLRDVEGWRSDEVRDLLGISAANQRVLLHRARSRVRRYVEERLGAERP